MALLLEARCHDAMLEAQSKISAMRVRTRAMMKRRRYEDTYDTERYPLPAMLAVT